MQVTDTAQILHCCGCGVGQRLQLQFDPWPGNLHMPRCGPKKTKKKRKKRKRRNSANKGRALGFCVISKRAHVPCLCSSPFREVTRWWGSPGAKVHTTKEDMPDVTRMAWRWKFYFLHLFHIFSSKIISLEFPSWRSG